MARLSPFVPFGVVLAFHYGLSGLCLTFSDTLYNMTICEKDVICVQSPNCQHGLQESLQKLSDSIVRGEVRFSSSLLRSTVKNGIDQHDEAEFL